MGPCGNAQRSSGSRSPGASHGGIFWRIAEVEKPVEFHRFVEDGIRTQSHASRPDVDRAVVREDDHSLVWLSVVAPFQNTEP